MIHEMETLLCNDNVLENQYFDSNIQNIILTVPENNNFNMFRMKPYTKNFGLKKTL